MNKLQQAKYMFYKKELHEDSLDYITYAISYISELEKSNGEMLEELIKINKMLDVNRWIPGILSNIPNVIEKATGKKIEELSKNKQRI